MTTLETNVAPLSDRRLRPTSRLRMLDLSRQKRFEVYLDGDITPAHTVGQASDRFVSWAGLARAGGEVYGAYSRGKLLDSKRRIQELSEEDAEWTVTSRVAAGAR